MRSSKSGCQFERNKVKEAVSTASFFVPSNYKKASFKLLIFLAKGGHSRRLTIMKPMNQPKIGRVSEPIDKKLWNKTTAPKVPTVVVTTKKNRRGFKG